MVPFQSQQHALFMNQFSHHGQRPALREFEPSQTGDFPSQEDLAGPTSSNDEADPRVSSKAGKKQHQNDKSTIQLRSGDAEVAPASAFALKDELNTIQINQTEEEKA